MSSDVRLMTLALDNCDGFGQRSSAYDETADDVESYGDAGVANDHCAKKYYHFTNEPGGG